MTRRIDARVVYLSRNVPHYKIRIVQSIARAIPDFHVITSTPLQPGRSSEQGSTNFDVREQNSLKVPHLARHAGAGFADLLRIDLPYETGRYLKELRPDVVISMELGTRSIAAARYRRRNPTSRLLLCTMVTPHTEEQRGWIRRRIRPRLYEAADAITYNGPLCQRYLEDNGVDPSKLYHFPYAANDLTLYDGPVERDDSETRNRLLCIGQLIDRKGIVPLVHQLSQYATSRPERRIELSLVGEGPLEDELSAIRTPSNLELKLLGFVQPDDLPDVMKEHGASISGTLADEWLMVVNESLHAGLPFIGSIYAQAVTTLVEDGFNGWQFDPLRPHSLGIALDAYFDASPEDITQMRHNARKSVVDLTPDWAAEGLLDAVEAVLSQPDR